MYIFVEHLFLFAEYKPVTLSIDNVILLIVSKCNTTLLAALTVVDRVEGTQAMPC